MKRWFSLLLTLALLLSLLPGAALAAEEQAPAGHMPAVQAQSEQPAEVPPEPDTPEEHTELLASGSATVSGTVSLPSGSSVLSDSYIYMYLCSLPVLDENGQVLIEPGIVKNSRVSFTKGQSSVSYSFTGVETGEYLLRVSSYVNSGSVLGGDFYFNADGTAANNPYAADPISVSAGNNTANLTLPAAPRSISGTLTFDQPASADTNFRVYCYDSKLSRSFASSVTVRQGAASAEFAIGVESGSYPIQFSNVDLGSYAYYTIYGDVSTNYSHRMNLNTADGSVSGLIVDGSSIMGTVSTNQLKVTVQLPAPLTQGRNYEVCLFNVDGNRSESSSIYVNEGQSAFSVELFPESGESFLVGYADVTGFSNSSGSPTGIRYAAESGITSQSSQAKVFTSGTGTEITIAEPACYTITGTLTRSGSLQIVQAAYALAEFDDGAVYAGRVLFSAGQESASYTIYVPQSHQGQSFHLSAGKAKGNTGTQVSDTALTDGGTHTLSGNLQIQENLALEVDVPTVQGIVSLPAGVTAPTGGLVINVGVVVDGYDYVSYATYYLPQGKSSFSYAICAPVQGETTIHASLAASASGIYKRALGTFSQNELKQADLTFQESVTIQGNVTVPDSCRDGIAAIQVSANGMLNGGKINDSLSIVILAGKTQGSYALTMPKGSILTGLFVRVQADTQNVLNTTSLYLQPDLQTFSTKYANLSFVLNNGLTLSTALSKAAFVSGTISLAEGLSAGRYSGRIQLEPVADGESFQTSFNFTGTSYDYKIPVSQGITGPYYICLYLYDGPGIIRYKNYYYVDTDTTTTDRNSATPLTLGEDGMVINLTIPKGKVISGSFTADDESNVIWTPNQEVTLRLEPVGGGTRSSATITPDAQGNWSATVDPDLTGNYKLYIDISRSLQTNIIPETYYYSTTAAAVTEASAATPITLGSEDLTGLKLYVETGWLLSGRISLPEGGYVTGGTVTVSMSARSSSGSYYYGNASVGSAGGNYQLVVPKENAEYQVTLNSVSSIPSEVSSNLYWGDQQTLKTGSIAGDTSGLDFTLVKAKAVITGTVYRPKNVTEYISMNIYAQVELSPGYIYSYHTNLSLDSNKPSTNFTIAIPESVNVQEYQLYYNIYSNVSGVLINQNIYLCQDGSLTTESNQAGTFSLDQPEAHEFTLLTAKPFATGRIYCPEELDRTMMFVVDYRPVNELSTLEMSPTAVEVMVGPNYGQQDEDGRWYSTYTLADKDIAVGSSYRLGYYSNDTSNLIDTNWHYINEDGSATSSEQDASVYTVPASGSSTLDFTPILWSAGSESYVLQSEHGISSLPQTAVYTYTYPDPTVEKLRVTFSARTDMDLIVNGSRYAFSSLAGQTLEVDGNTLRVELAAFTYFVNKFGFAVEKVEAVGGSSTPQTGATAVYTPSGSSDEAILDGVKAGEPVRVTLVGQPTDVQHELLGALYDEKGILLDFVQVPVTFTESGCTTSLSFEEYGGAVTLKIFLVDEDLAPQMENCAFTQQ